ncbi:MAG TPA: hypothetical protein VHS09_02260 [Polyangiaceae bacterium]|jgi:hypothetical protein|nr:hypothetical protein [Polyangiaceae bacterium]
MPLRNHTADVALEPQREIDEISGEHFDRAAFARRALELVNPPRTTVAICEGASRMRVASGRLWGRARDEETERWALLAIPQHASRRAIALAVAELAHLPRPYVLDVLMGSSRPASPPLEPE